MDAIINTVEIIKMNFEFFQSTYASFKNKPFICFPFRVWGVCVLFILSAS